MIGSLRRSLARLVAGISRFPPPRLPDGADAAAIRAGLSGLRSRGPSRYARFFLSGQPLLVARRERALFAALEAAGLASRLTPTLYEPCARLFPFNGRFVATDLLSRDEVDQVFSLMFEQIYLVRNMRVGPGERILELCVGSGVNSLFAAQAGGLVTGVDISERALAFSRFNLALNGAADRAELLAGSLFGPVAGRRFDVVLVNPPFEPTPPGENRFLHSDAGEDGLDLVRAVLAEVEDHLEPDGRLEMITFTPASERALAIVPLLEDALGGYRLRVDVLDEMPMSDHAERFREATGFEGWRARLDARGLDRLCLVFVRASRGGEPGLFIEHPEPEIAACHALADDWR